MVRPDVEEQRSYMFEDRELEDDRLVAQSKVLDPLTERLLGYAGIGPGMRVLDLGSGAGNVSLIAADLVGPNGSVLGVERDGEAVKLARARAGKAGRGNVEFLEGDVRFLDGVPGGFDAVVGRLIFMHITDPAAVIRRATELVRPGGVVCFHEADMSYRWAVPETPLWRQVRQWVLAAVDAAEADGGMGLALFRVFRAAGLPGPELTLEAPVGGGEYAPAFGWTNVLRGLLPLLEHAGIATKVEVDPDTLTARLLADVVKSDGIVIGPVMVGAWTTVPER